jgi:hypothetical protein
MDRTDAAPDPGGGGAVSARPGVRRRRGSLPRRAAVTEGEGRAVADSCARRAARIGPARGAWARGVASARSRGVVPAAGPSRGGAAPGRRRGPRGPELQLAADPRPAHTMGELLHERGDELQLAAAAGAARDPRLRGGARGGPPRHPGPLRAVLEAAGIALRAVARARAVAAPPRARAAALVRAPGYSQRKKRTARNSPAAAQAATTSTAVAVSPPPPTIASERPSIRCFSGSASAIAFSASGRSSAE